MQATGRRKPLAVSLQSRCHVAARRGPVRMVYDDPIYGPESIAEPVLLDLLGSEGLGRLKGVLQHGVTALLEITKPITRYEHSVGVMLLARRVGGGPREPVAAPLPHLG